MPDALQRWCLFCDLDIRSSVTRGPRVRFNDYVDDIVARSQSNEAFRVYDRENRIMRISHANLIHLPNGHRGLAMVLTLGDRRGANPSFVHFARGDARDAERLDGEVKGRSAHCIIDLEEDEDHVGRHTMMLEDAASLGRTPVTRLLGSVIKDISTDRDERFVSPETGNLIMLRPHVEVWPQKSRQMEEALATGRLGVVELYDTRGVPTFDEQPDFRVKKRIIRVEVEPDEDGFAGPLDRLRRLGQREGYGHMKLSWRLRNGQEASSDMRTDLEDLGTALLARRELVQVQTPMSDASSRLNDEFVEAMSECFR